MIAIVLKMKSNKGWMKIFENYISKANNYIKAYKK